MAKVLRWNDFLNEDEETVSPAAPVTPEADPKPEVAGGDGFGEKPFAFTKNGDASNYFFKIDVDDHARGFVLTIGKFARFASPSEAKGSYAVLSIQELSVEALEQAVVDKGAFEPNQNQVIADDRAVSRIVNKVASCVSDYLQRNPKVVKFYDEIPAAIKSQYYREKLISSFDRWPGGAEVWTCQEIEPKKLNIITK